LNEREILKRKENNLHVALDKIERSDSHVGKSTTEDPTGTACCIVSRRKHADFLFW